MHLCARPLNITRRACCQLLALLNDSQQIAPCTPMMWADESNSTLLVQYAPPVYLPDPEEIREDHLTFLVGILILMVIALSATFALSRISRPKLAVGYGSLTNSEIFMWLPRGQAGGRTGGRGGRRESTSFFLLLREMTCRRDDSHRNTSSLSILSQMDMSLLPSYQTATATPSSAGSIPPPPYFATQLGRGRGYQSEAADIGIPLTDVTSPAASFHSYAYTQPPPEMTRSI